jgi:hypothetical protein
MCTRYQAICHNLKATAGSSTHFKRVSHFLVTCAVAPINWQQLLSLLDSMHNSMGLMQATCFANEYQSPGPWATISKTAALLSTNKPLVCKGSDASC